MTHYFKHIRKAIIKKRITRVGKDAEKWELAFISVGP